jgi:enoyl-[acyl-carrier protein] reductase II
MINNKLKQLWQKGSDFLGTEHAILCGAMTWVSERNLVASVSNAGGFGIIASGSMSPDLLRGEIAATKTLTHKPFGVNLIVMHPQLEELAQVCIDADVTHVVLAGGIPSKAIVRLLKGAGVKVVSFAPSLKIAQMLVKQGIDALIIEGAEAGGHIGPVSTSVLAQEILPHIKEVPVFVAGGIGRGEALALYLRMGAAGCQMGTRFVCASESIAHARFKESFIRASARNAVPSVQVDERFPVIPVRAIENAAAKEFTAFQRQVIEEYTQGHSTQKEAQLKIEHFWAGALRRAVIDGDTESGSLMAGQSVGMVTKIIPTAEIIEEIVSQASQALEETTSGTTSS